MSGSTRAETRTAHRIYRRASESGGPVERWTIAHAVFASSREKGVLVHCGDSDVVKISASVVPPCAH